MSLQAYTAAATRAETPRDLEYRLFGQVTEARVDVMAAAQTRMFRRRGVKQRPLDVQLLHDMYELTRHERQLANEPLAL